MADFVFNIALGRVAHYATLPAASDALIVIPVLAAGVQADATLRDYDDISTLFAAANDEATTGGWNRKTLSSGVTVTVDDTNERVDVDIADQTWTAVSTGTVSDLIIAYDADTGTGTDANLIPLTCHDFAITPDGSDVTAQIATAGFYRAQ